MALEKKISLRETMKERLLDLFRKVDASKKLLVIDEKSLRVIDAVCNLSDILDTGVFLVESLEKARQPYPSMDAIYLICPDQSSIQSLINDFERLSGPLYAHAHIFAINEIPRELFTKMTSSYNLSQRVVTLQQVYSDFMACESRFFHFGNCSNMNTLFADNKNVSPQALTELDKMAKKLLSVWVALGEYPLIRYHKSEIDPLSPKLANLLQDYLESHANKIGLSTGPKGNAEIIILSRPFDMLSPVLHDFTYQAMAADLLNIQEEDGSGSMKYSPDGGKTYSALDELDSLWITLRHGHIAKTSELIVQKFAAFTSENKAAQRAMGNEQQPANLSDIKETLNAMSEYHDLKSQYSLHMSIAQACMSKMNSKRLMEVAGIEQNLATGKDDEGDNIKPSSMWPALSSLLTQDSLSISDKIRLAIIYALCTGEVEAAALSRCGFSNQDIELVKKCNELGRRTIEGRIPQKKSKFHPESEYTVSRFVPSIKFLIENALLGNIDNNLYPIIRQASAQAAAKGGAFSLRSGGASSAAAIGQRIVMVFIIGGSSHSEVRTVYECSDAGKGDVLIGSTHLATPEFFLKDLRQLI
jgi:syntaxin-binding protein 1